MINAQFIEDSTQLITQIEKRGIKLENGNMLVAKVKADRKVGNLYVAESAAEREDYHSGFARILAIAPDITTVKVGDYIFHSHEARYTMHVPSIREILGVMVPEGFVYAVQDNEVILHLPAEVLQG